MLLVLGEAIDHLSWEQEKIRKAREYFGLYQEEIQLLESMEENKREEITGEKVHLVKLGMRARCD